MSEITRNQAIQIVEDIRTAISAGSVTNTLEARVMEYCVVVLGRRIEETGQSGYIENLPDIVAFLAGFSSPTTLRSLLNAITEKIPAEASGSNKLADKAFVTALANALQNAVDTINGKIPAEASISNQMADKAFVTALTNALQNAVDTINGKIPAEASSSNQMADKAFVTNLTTALQNAVDTINANIGNGYVYAGIATPSGTPVSGKVFYLARQAGQYTNFGGLTVTEGINILKRNGSAWTQEQLVSMADIYKNPLIGYYECDTAGDTAAKAVTAAGYVLPATGGSVKIKMANRNTVANATLNINSTGAKPLYYNGRRAEVGNTWDTNEIIEVFYDGANYQAYNVAGSNGDGVFDISAYNLTDGKPTPYEDLEAALGPDGEHVPLYLHKGGVSVTFIQGNAQDPGNKYVQYRLMSTSFSIDEKDWQGVDDKPTPESDNFLKSGDIYNELNVLNVPISISGTYTDRSNLMNVNIPQGTTVKFTVRVQGLSENDIDRLSYITFLYGESVSEYDYRHTIDSSIKTQLKETGSYSFNYTPGHDIILASLWFLSGTTPTSGNVVTFTTQEYIQKYATKEDAGNVLVSEVDNDCVVGQGGTFFDYDVNILSGSVIKFEITGYGSILGAFRYNINNSGNIAVEDNHAFYRTLENITHIRFGYSSNSVIANGTVNAKISILSNTEKEILDIEDEINDINGDISDLNEQIDIIDGDAQIIDEGTAECTQGQSVSYFRGDVNIPKGKIIVFEILSGYLDVVNRFRYNINNSGNVAVDSNIIYLKATENVTSISFGTSSSSVISNGNVTYKISAISEIGDIKETVTEIQKDIDGYTIGEPVVACTQGVRPTFFDDDVYIPAGKVLKFQVLSGYPDIITDFSYSINGGDAQYANSDIAFYEATENVTHLKLSTAKANVISSGDVKTGIYVMSEIDVINDKLDEDETKLVNHETRITALETKVGGNSYDTDIDEIAEKVFNELSESSGTNEEKVVFLHVTDTHSSDGDEYHMDFDRAVLHMNMVSQVAKAVNSNFIIHTGDAIHGINSTSVTESYRALIKGYNANIPLIFCEGNYAHDFGNNEEKLVRGQVQSYFGHNKMWIEDKTIYNTNDTVKSYFYFDDKKTKIRYVILDAQDANRGSSKRRDIGFSTEQITFVTSVLNDALTNGYSVFFFSHMPPSANLYHIEEGEDNSFGIETEGNGSLLIAAIKNFIDNGGIMLGFIYGHIHQDNMYFDSVTGIQYIGLVSDAPTKKPNYPVTWGTLVTWDRNLNDVTQFAFDVYVVSPASKKIKIFRFGAGIDRQYTLL